MLIDRLHLDTVLFGGGAAGLWMLDAIHRSGRRALLLEANALGSGQTVASQGIIHGGLKYTLRGAFTKSARAIARMPEVWQQCLRGEAAPNLTRTRLRSEHCYVWRTESVSSRLAMIGARAGLRVAPVTLETDARPAALQGCPGVVARLDEQVIDTVSFLRDLADQHRGRIWKIDANDGLTFAVDTTSGSAPLVQLRSGASHVELKASYIIFAAGAGNAMLRTKLGHAATQMQRRPLHMAMARGMMPQLNGHCVDGRATRLTITSDEDSAGRSIWQIGGQIAEDGVHMDRAQLIDHTKRELAACLPGIDLSGVEFATYRVDRAERESHGKRPEDAVVISEGPLRTCWPTKLALVPHLSDDLLQTLPPAIAQTDDPATFRWPAPDIAQPPWETEHTWTAAR